MADKPKLADCVAALAEAREQFDLANTKKNSAERELTSALNQLNDAQKAVDTAVAELKKDAPWNSDWYSQKQRPVREAA